MSQFGLYEKTQPVTSEILEGFDFSANRKQQTPVTNFNYDGMLVMALPGPTRKTARYDIELACFIKKNFTDQNRPKYAAIGFKEKQCIVIFDNPAFVKDALNIAPSNNIISSKHKVQEIIKISGCRVPEETGDELRLYFNLVQILNGIYRLDLIATPKDK